MVPGKFAIRTALFWILTRPAGCGAAAAKQGLGGKPVPGLVTQGPWLLATGAPRVLKSTPDEAVVSLDMTVLLMKSTFNASTSETPAPSQPAMLLVMILLVTLTEYHCSGFAGKVTTSEPLMFCKRSP